MAAILSRPQCVKRTFGTGKPEPSDLTSGAFYALAHTRFFPCTSPFPMSVPAWLDRSVTVLQWRKLNYVCEYRMNQKHVSCKNINWQNVPRFAEAWDVLWCDIDSVDDISQGEYDQRTVILKSIRFIAHWPHTAAFVALWYILRGGCMTPHLLFYLAWVGPMVFAIWSVDM